MHTGKRKKERTGGGMTREIEERTDAIDAQVVDR
jgi:hypothetical protein